MSDIALVFTPDGTGRGLYTEAIDLEAIGDLSIQRASEIEFDNSSGLWIVRIPGDRRVLYRHPSRQACLDWERQYLDQQEDMKHESFQYGAGATAAGA